VKEKITTLATLSLHLVCTRPCVTFRRSDACIRLAHAACTRARDLTSPPLQQREPTRNTAWKHTRSFCRYAFLAVAPPPKKNMLRRNARLRREYLYRKGLEGKEKAEYERKRLIREALAGTGLR